MSPTFSPARPRPLAWMLAALLLALLAGCATVETSSGPVSRMTLSATMVQAETLANQAATQKGAQRRQTVDQIEALLSGLDNATLQRDAAALPAGNPLYNYAGRALLRRGLPLPRPFDRSAWQFDAGNRPPADSDGYRPPVKLAVLLPLSGNLATAAAPVRDGFLTGYYGETRRRPEVTFYDTSTGAIAAYDRAVAEGNDFVVGPLGRDEVGALFNRGTLPVPMLALNRAQVPPPAGNASFSLSPEDEGIAAAEFLLDRGAHSVLVIGAEDDTQRRAVASLRERLAERGGVVTDVVGEGTADFAPFAAKPGGIDAIFLATRGSAARQLIPRLALAGLAGKPRVATSQLLSGTGKAEEDRVLDGIAFPSESWTTHGIRNLPPAVSAAAILPNAKGPAARLFGFGYDAWLITAYLERLATSATGIEGATGVLRIDGFGNVQRTPAWSTFSNGIAVPLASATQR
ncbi:penicillin-binding protein activator [Lysobacter yangpyeongensis]|uniref:Penicillin-binding protein activator n=1 Tax=Lysobacter yangpyeongensis TaxID=346182 RepID=A0ABW0SNM8_9GAMM